MPLPIELQGPPPRDVRRVRVMLLPARRQWLPFAVAGAVVVALFILESPGRAVVVVPAVAMGLVAWWLLRKERRLEAQLLEVIREGAIIGAHVLAVEPQNSLGHEVRVGFRGGGGAPFVGSGTVGGRCPFERGAACDVFVHRGLAVLYVDGGFPVFLHATRSS